MRRCIALGKAKGVQKQAQRYKKANGEVIVTVDDGSALINTTICVKHGTQSRDVAVQRGENSSSGTLVMQFGAGAVFEM